MMRHDWSQMPPEVLEFISGKLNEVEDYIIFRAVCKLWRSATNPISSKLPSRLPWLLLPYHPAISERRFFSLSRQKVYIFNLPEFCGHVIWGTQHGGWLVMANRSLEISMLNPLNREVIRLPPITSSDDHNNSSFVRVRQVVDPFGIPNDNVLYNDLSDMYRCYCFMFDNAWLVAITKKGFPKFLYCKVGDLAWTMLHTTRKISIASIALHGRRFYGIHRNGEVAVWDLNFNNSPPPRKEGRFIPSPNVTHPFYEKVCRAYLVTFYGELHLLTCEKTLDESNRAYFSLYKLDEHGQLSWSKLTAIDGHSLFLTLYDGHAITIPIVHRCMKNTIYTVDLSKDKWSQVSPVHPVDSIPIEDGFIDCTKPYWYKLPIHFLPPTWVTPSFC